VLILNGHRSLCVVDAAESILSGLADVIPFRKLGGELAFVGGLDIRDRS